MLGKVVLVVAQEGKKERKYACMHNVSNHVSRTMPGPLTACRAGKGLEVIACLHTILVYLFCQVTAPKKKKKNVRLPR